MNQEYFSVKEYSVLVGLSETTVRRKIKKGELTAVQVGGPRGPQYMIMGKEIDQAAMTTEVAWIDKPFPIDQLAVVMFNTIRASLADYDLALADKIDRQATAIEAALTENSQVMIDHMIRQAQEIQQLHDKVDNPKSEHHILEKIDRQALEIQALHNRLNNQGLIDEITRQAAEIKNLHVELYRIRKALEAEVQKQGDSSWWSNLFKK